LHSESGIGQGILILHLDPDREFYTCLVTSTDEIETLPIDERNGMFETLRKRKTRNRVQQLLASHISRHYLPQVGKTGRQQERRAFCEVVWVIGWDDENQEIDFDRVSHAVTRDISKDGLSLLRTAPLDDEQLLIGLDGDGGRHFLQCQLEHCTPLGHGFYQVGLYADEVVELDPLDIERLKQSARPHAAETAGV